MPEEYYYGLDAELKQKQDAKYDPQQELLAKQWIEAVLGEKLESGDFIDNLKDGITLTKLFNKVSGENKPIAKQKMAFMQMENINNFLLGAQSLGVPKADLFQTVDLYERKNPHQVLLGIFSFARHVCKNKPNIPQLGPKLADKHSVEFTEEQLKAGTYIPSQQTGHAAAIAAQERGATQSGINYGKGREIVNKQ